MTVRRIRLALAAAVLLPVVAAAGTAAGEEGHVRGVLARILDNVRKLRTADPEAVPMAFWDFDGTIICGDSGIGLVEDGVVRYRGLIEEVIDAGFLPMYRGEGGFRKWLQDYTRMTEIGCWLAQGYDAQMFAGVSAAEVDAFCRKTIREKGLDRWYFASSMAIWRALAEAGVENYVVSANIEALVRNAAFTLGVSADRIRGARTELDGGRWTARLLQPVPHGEGKTDAVRDLVRARPHGVAVAAFGNSYATDGAFLRYVATQPSLPGGAAGTAMMINGGNPVPGFSEHFVCVTQSKVVGPVPAARAAEAEAHVVAQDVKAGRVELTCKRPGSWRFSLERVSAEGDLEIVRVAADADRPAVPPRFDVRVSFPAVDVPHLWKPEYAYDGSRPNWTSADTRPSRTSFAWWTPVYCLHNSSDLNRFTVATSECVRDVPYQPRLKEETLEAAHLLTFFPDPVAPMSHYETLVRLDRRAVFYGQAIEDATAWILETRGEKPLATPPSAFEPLYSSWYSFHQDVFDREIEAECAEAAKMGMKTLIVDDGWQTDDTGRGYAYCGDWQVSTNRFGDMRAHVAKVHALGFKYMVWFSMPSVGVKSANYARFKGRYLSETSNEATLDPRFPEVRAFLSGIYEKAMRDWDIDGFKLDFINSFCLFGKEDPAVAENYAGRDIREIPAAVEALVAEATRRIRAVKPDALIEFRQTYMGPGVRKYGNMFRVADCCGVAVANRAGVASLRLTSGGNAVHSDMLAWHPSETPQQGARQILSAIFGTVQYSMMLRTLPADHKRMMSHWIAFSKAHEEALQHGAFRPRHPELDYPVLEGESSAERVVGVYVDDVIADCGPADRTVYVLNGSGAGKVTLRLGAAPTKVEAFDTFGEPAAAPTLGTGVQDVSVPVSGYLKLTFASDATPQRD